MRYDWEAYFVTGTFNFASEVYHDNSIESAGGRNDLFDNDRVEYAAAAGWYPVEGGNFRFTGELALVDAGTQDEETFTATVQFLAICRRETAFIWVGVKPITDHLEFGTCFRPAMEAIFLNIKAVRHGAYSVLFVIQIAA